MVESDKIELTPEMLAFAKRMEESMRKSALTDIRFAMSLDRACCKGSEHYCTFMSLLNNDGHYGHHGNFKCNGCKMYGFCEREFRRSII